MTMTSSNQNLILNAFIEAGVPITLWGEPGTAKSSIIESMGRALDRHTEVVLASIREPADFGGLPYITDEGVRLSPPAFARILGSQARSLLLLDEANLATMATEGAMMRVVLDRKAGDQYLGDGCSIVMACNPPECSAGGREVSMPFANRGGHLDWKPEADDWVAGMISGFPDVAAQRAPEDWEDGVPEMQSLIAAYIKHAPGALHALPKDGEPVRGWPSRRSWTNTARVLACAAAMGHGPTSALASDVAVALVGPGAALAFTTWLHTQDLVDPESALANPTTVALPTRGDRVLSFIGAVAARALAKGKRTHAERGARFAAAGVILGRLAAAGHADLVLPAATALTLGREGPTKDGQEGWPIPDAILKVFPLVKLAASK